MAEFALILTIALIVLLGTIQLALVGNAALALTKLAYDASRYASVNPTYSQSQILSYVQSVAPSTVNENGGSNLTVSLSPCASPIPFGSPVSVTISYDASGKVFLPNPFLGISFPTTLTSTQTAFCE